MNYTAQTIDRIRAAEAVRCDIEVASANDSVRATQQLARFRAIEEAVRTNVLAGVSSFEVEVAVDYYATELLNITEWNATQSALVARALHWAKSRGIEIPERFKGK